MVTTAEIKLGDFFILRRPLLPVEVYYGLHCELENGVSLTDALRKIVNKPICQEAIFYASATLQKQLIDWLNNRKPASDQLLLSLYKYVIRMTTRSTPFGLFAGVSLGEWSTETTLRFEEDIHQKVARLDANIISEMLVTITDLPLIQQQLKYFVNPTCWLSGDEIRYVGYTDVNKQRSYFLNIAQNTVLMSLLLEQARQGNSIPSLINALHDEGIESLAATTYVQDLINCQLLVPDLEVNLTGQDMISHIKERLLTLDQSSFITDPLVQLEQLLHDPSLENYAAVEGLVSEFTDAFNKDLIQCDVLFPAVDLTIERAIGDQIGQCIQALIGLNDTQEADTLTLFKQRFYARFEEQEVPLLMALDPDLGIGYDHAHEDISPWLEIVSWNEPLAMTTPTGGSSEKLFNLFNEALRTGEFCIRLTEAEISELSPDQPNSSLPASAYALGNLINPSGQPITKDNFQFHLTLAGGPSAGNLLGRFAHLSSTIAQKLEHCLTEEQQAYPDTILAEIVHLPESRTGNVLHRPVLRPYEIPVLTASSVALDHQIMLDDLFISVPQGSTVILRSKKLNRRIIPRLTTAHNYSNGLAHYRFLCDLQHQEGVMSLRWNWGALQSMPFLPRVQFNNLTLSRARWLWSADEQDSSKLFASQWSHWQQKYQVPRYIVLAEFDNELLIDTSLSVGLRVLEQASRRNKTLVLYECLWQKNEPIVVSADGKHWCHELLIPMKINQFDEKSPTYRTSTSGINSVQRYFPPGSEWLYVKLYTGPAVAETFLHRHLPVLLQQLKNSRLLINWFFIRYADPDWHLRLRFHCQPGDSTTLFGEVSKWLNDLNLELNNPYQIRYDTYHRELERYGENHINFCENWFGHNSQLVIQFLKTIHNSQDEWLRLYAGCRGVYEILNTWQINPSDQIRLLTSWRDAFLEEFKVDKAMKKKMNDLFREKRLEFVDALLDDTRYRHLYEPFFEDTSPLLPNAYQSDSLFRKHIPVELLPDLTHLFINRLFMADQRKHELMVCYYLTKTLKHLHSLPMHNP
ncbi:lantibiotic dehydratase [Spirosoma fluviale]|uniref:Thiopeptide-type bacteriocin biosynthesis domain-containing protein n=1 Tax=Spirosoma fluviale TaxID=1597977 RepID=A0A286GU91_9BACT|nr:lantibiotic dehydratase [Spirosoma fluviale]SOD99133.1 thiopeptide-type bacteriocin biosynthesis domain-containing protein [Spirosoma fluviale]